MSEYRLFTTSKGNEFYLGVKQGEELTQKEIDERCSRYENSNVWEIPKKAVQPGA